MYWNIVAALVFAVIVLPLVIYIRQKEQNRRARARSVPPQPPNPAQGQAITGGATPPASTNANPAADTWWDRFKEVCGLAYGHLWASATIVVVVVSLIYSVSYRYTHPKDGAQTASAPAASTPAAESSPPLPYSVDLRTMSSASFLAKCESDQKDRVDYQTISLKSGEIAKINLAIEWRYRWHGPIEGLAHRFDGKGDFQPGIAVGDDHFLLELENTSKGESAHPINIDYCGYTKTL